MVRPNSGMGKSSKSAPVFKMLAAVARIFPVAARNDDRNERNLA